MGGNRFSSTMSRNTPTSPPDAMRLVENSTMVARCPFRKSGRQKAVR
jgi:hypothetical protein